MKDGFQRKSNCSYKGCPNRALWYPVVKIWPLGDSKKHHQPMECELSVAFCEEHKDAFKFTDVPALVEIARQAAKRLKVAEPDPDSAEIEFRPLLLCE